MFFEKFCDDWMFLDWKLEHDIRLRMNKRKEHRIEIHYKIIAGECCITEVGPPRIGENWEFIKMEYYINNHPSTKKIQNVENRCLGRVAFIAIEHDESSGHVQGSTA